MCTEKIWFIRAWYMAGVLQSPICTTKLTIFPSGVVTAECSTCSGIIQICQYAFFKSKSDWYFAHATLLSTPSISGNDEDIFTVFAFCTRKSTTVRNSSTFPIFFPSLDMNIIGMVFCALEIFHRPDFR